MRQKETNKRSSIVEKVTSFLGLSYPQELLIAIHQQQQDILAKLEPLNGVDFEKITQQLADLHTKAHETKPVVKTKRS